MSAYWLSRWLDYHDITTETDAERALLSPTIINSLRKAARKAIPSLLEPSETAFSVVAGRGIDLSGQLACRSDICRIRQANELFKHVWHYFDQIIVQDNVVYEINMHWHDSPDNVLKDVLSQIKILLYLKSIGAEDLVDFRIKARPCTTHWQKHAEEAGILDIVNKLDTLTDFLLQDAKIRFTQDESGVINFTLAHPTIFPPHSGKLENLRLADGEASLRRGAAEIVSRRFIAHLTSDVAASNVYNAALGAADPIHDMLLRQIRGVTAEEVLFNLNLPVLDGLQPWDLIDIRREEGAYFATFRDSLLMAARERLKENAFDSGSKVAEEIRLDIIEPELNQITARLQAAQSTLSRKSAVGLVLGSLSTTCGLLAGFGPSVAAVSGTAVAITCTGTATAKYLDDLKDISLNNMFFLWKAREHVPH